MKIETGKWRRVLFFACVLAQALTVIGTWELWRARSEPPNLPLLDGLAALPVGWLMLGSLGIAAIWPRIGLPLHATVLAVGIAGDQFRLQPQFFGLVILMWGCRSPTGEFVCRWYLASMWFWAGMHKAVSADWWGHRSWHLVERAHGSPEHLYMWFAVTTVVVEMGLGLLAVFRPKAAAVICVIAHVGIVVYLSPLVANWNFSVVPWNICTAIVGAVVLWRSSATVPSMVWQKVVAAALMIYPAGFYSGWVDRALCHVLYSDNLPRGLITNSGGPIEIVGWGDLGVPFPSQQRLLKQYFETTAEPGDKLHVWDRRWGKGDRFFELDANRQADEIEGQEFFSGESPGSIAGIGLDDRRAVFALTRGGARLRKRAGRAMIFAVTFSPGSFEPRQLKWLAGLPNLTEVQLKGCAVGDDDLRELTKLPRLRGIGIEGTRVTAEGLERLRNHPQFEVIETDLEEEGGTTKNAKGIKDGR